VLPEHFLFRPEEIACDPARAATVSRNALERLVTVCSALELWLFAHLVEEESGQFYSSVFAIEPQGIAGRYRATHLSEWDKEWATPGAEISVFETPFGNVGIMLGFEGMIPEVARVLALSGADVVVWPTSWRAAAEFKFIAHERAMENRIVLIAANRQDSAVEGPSLLIQPAGYPQNTLASELPYGRRGFVTRFAQLSASRSKRETNNTDLLVHRRPELYNALTAPLATNA
jgi:predicted amidohydrolase